MTALLIVSVVALLLALALSYDEDNGGIFGRRKR
jgi:hypothetical protein